MAVFLSLICPGLGHVVIGEPMKGFGWAIAFWTSFIFILAFVGIFTTPIVYLWCLSDVTAIQRKQLTEDIASGMKRSQHKD